MNIVYDKMDNRQTTLEYNFTEQFSYSNRGRSQHKTKHRWSNIQIVSDG